MKGRELLFLLIVLLLPVPAAGAEPVLLKANLQAAISNPFYGWSLARLKEEVERQSKGTLAIEIAEKLFRDEQVIGAVTSGAIEIGFTSSTLFADRVPAVGIIGQPFLFNFPALVRAATSPGSEIRKLIDDGILGKIGLRVLWWQSLSVNVFFSKGWDVADVGLLKGKRVAVPSKTAGGLIAQCGGIPTALSVEGHEGAIRERTLDMAMLALPGLQSQGLWKATDSITYTAHAPVEMLLVINEKVWQSLSPGHQAILSEAARLVERQSRDRVAEIETRIYEFAASKGMMIKALTPDQVAEWRACSADMLAAYMERNGELARKLMDAYGKLRTDPCCTAGPSTAVFTRR
ncbi:MAG TPA: TRAP transporter substrate-binding protein DctP [Hyphomicrobiaceae bacterium]|jgi:C4-dicarboxylate-binding protein DctP|nr:TRAP transporter substrate-binding protein DctP [Hyphomicrobiaceae bacterium]